MRVVSRERWSRLGRLVACGAAVVLSAGVCPQQSGVNPEVVQALTDLNDGMASLSQQTADMQEQIDSLHLKLARQDTLIQRLLSITPLPSP
jgi:hypothetical protein